MPRIRTLKPEFPQSESMGRISREARLCFILLWTQADDSGRTRAASRLLASLLYPFDEDAPGLIGGWLDELEREGCIRRYVADGNQMIDIPKWLKHQKIDRPSQSRLPEFVEGSRALVEASTTDLGPRTLDQDLGPRIKIPPIASQSPPKGGMSDFETFWATYPRKVGKGQARRAWQGAAKKAKPETILEGLARYRASLDGADPKFIRHAATWLHGEGWLDEQTTNGKDETPLTPEQVAASDDRWTARAKAGEAVPDGIIRNLVAKGVLDKGEADRRGVQVLC